MYRIKKEYIGKNIIKGSNNILLRDDMTDKEILYVKNIISPHFVEEVIEEVIQVKIEEGKITEEPIKRKRKK
jgi:hypothetical protein